MVKYQPAVAAENASLEGATEYIATIRGDQETDLSFKVGGILELIGLQTGKDWREGEIIKKGQVLARLKQENFLNDANVARAQADLAKSNFERVKELWASKAVSQQEYDTLLANRKSADANLAQAEQTLRDATLNAPFDGTILSRSANAGETMRVGSPVLRIADLQTMSVELGVPDTLVNRFREGSQLPIAITALEGVNSYTGRVFEVGVAARPDTRLFKVLIKVENPKGEIKSGMTARVPVARARALPAHAVLVPLSALITRSRPTADPARQLAVFVVEGEQVKERPIKTDDLIGSSILVTEGLQVGEKVVVAGASLLYDNAMVSARPLAEAANAPSK